MTVSSEVINITNPVLLILMFVLVSLIITKICLYILSLSKEEEIQIPPLRKPRND